MPAPEIIFYDGHCGLCHRWVKFVLPRDPDGSRFRFAPLQGSTVQEKLTEQQRAALPDSVVVLTDDGRLLTRSTAVLHITRKLGGATGFAGKVMSIIPQPLRDLGYDAVAAVRHQLFKQPDDACPLLPPDLRARFLP